MPLTAYRRHLTGCEHKHKGQAYTLCACPIWCYGYAGDSLIRQSLQTSDAAKALRRLDRLERGGSIDGAKSPLLSVAVSQYLGSVKVAPSTLRRYSGTLTPLCEFMDVPVSDVTTDRLKAYRGVHKVADGTWRSEIGQLRTFFAWCVSEHKWIQENPAKPLRLPKADDLATAPLTPDEVSALIGACDQIRNIDPGETEYIRRRSRALVYILLYSGLRISDVAALERSALVGRHLTLRIIKTGVRQKVLLHESAANALAVLPSVNPKYFFWSGSSDLQTCVGGLRRVISALGRLAKVHAHPHRFRDTFAVELLTNGADIRTVQQLLGHTSVRTTEKHYAHFVAAHQRLLDDAASTLDFERGSGPVLLKSGNK